MKIVDIIRRQSSFYIKRNMVQTSLKPIFHCDAKSFALGTFVSPNAKDSTFAFYPTLNLKVLPTPDTSQWNIGGVGAGVGHVHFMLFMSISFAWGTQRKLVFQWNMGLLRSQRVGYIPLVRKQICRLVAHTNWKYKG